MAEPRRALLAQTHFEHLAGSELVILELVEALRARGWSCEVAAASLGQPMADLARRAGARVRNDPAACRPLAHDLLWIQTRVEPLMDWSPGADERPATLAVFAHLDLGWTLAQPGVALEGAVLDAAVVTSEEAIEHFAAAGLPRDRILPFRNAAPAAFERPGGHPRPALRRLLLVSNHPPPEALEAMAHLRARGVEAAWWGAGGEVRGRRVTPADLDGADAVVSIGKTVPYALLNRLPAYVYDHHGGPGWLTEASFRPAMRTNFSGRCTTRRLDGEAIAREIWEGFEAAAEHAAAMDDGAFAPFRLDPFLDDLLARPGAPLAARRAALEAASPLIAAEARLARAAHHYFAAWRAEVRRRERAAA